MTTAIIGKVNEIATGALLRLEKDEVFGKVNVVLPDAGVVGVVTPLPYEGSVASRRIFEEFEDCTYVRVTGKQGIYLIAEVIVPIDFSYTVMRGEFAGTSL